MCGIFQFFFGCCGHFSPSHDRQPLTIRQNRSCTDKLCILLYLVSWVGILLILIHATQNGGDPNKLIRPTDLNGNVCGYSSDTLDYPYGAQPNPITNFFSFVCVSDCLHTNDITADDMAIRYESTEFLHFCVPLPNATIAAVQSGLTNGIDDNDAVIGRSIGDLYTTYNLIIICCFICVLLSFVYLFFLRIFAGIIIWLCILLTLIGGFFMSYTFLTAAYDADPNTVSSSRIDTYKYTGWTTLGVSVLFLIVIIALRKQIQIAIEVIKEAAHALSDMKIIVLFPFLTALLALAYLALWVYIALCIFSVYTASIIPTSDSVRHYIYGYPLSQLGQYNNNPANSTIYTFDTSYRPYLIYHVFHGFWTMEILIYFTYISISGAVANWYFSSWNEYETEKVRGFQPHQLAPFPLLRSIWRSFRFHMGTVIFAACIIAVVKTIRALIQFVENRTRGHPPNPIQKALFCMLKCCLWCVDCCLDKINKNALIWTSIWGDPFISSACSSFAVIWRNLFRVAAIHGVESILLFIGKMTISFGTMGIGAVILYRTPSYNDNVQSAWVPCIVILIFSFLISSTFFLIFETVIDSTFFCFLVDSENADHERCDMCAHKELRALVGKYHQISVDEAAQKGANVEMVQVKKADGVEHPQVVRSQTKVAPAPQR